MCVSRWTGGTIIMDASFSLNGVYVCVSVSRTAGISVCVDMPPVY